MAGKNYVEHDCRRYEHDCLNQNQVTDSPAGDNLELVKLEPEDPPAVLDEGADAQRARWRPWVHGCLQVPHLDLAIISATDNSLTVEPDKFNLNI